jgi:CcmD family protein
MIKRLFWTFSGLLLTVPVLAAQAPAGQTTFEPVENLPPTEQLPAAPLLITAYAFVWVAVFVYVWLIWRRLNRVEREMHTLQHRQSQRTGAR